MPIFSQLQYPFDARVFPSSTMIGMGLTPEGVLQNYAIYNFLTDTTLRSEGTDVSKWWVQVILNRDVFSEYVILG